MRVPVLEPHAVVPPLDPWVGTTPQVTPPRPRGRPLAVVLGIAARARKMTVELADWFLSQDSETELAYACGLNPRMR